MFWKHPLSMEAIWAAKPAEKTPGAQRGCKNHLEWMLPRFPQALDSFQSGSIPSRRSLGASALGSPPVGNRRRRRTMESGGGPRRGLHGAQTPGKTGGGRGSTGGSAGRRRRCSTARGEGARRVPRKRDATFGSAALDAVKACVRACYMPTLAKRVTRLSQASTERNFSKR